MQLRQYQRQRRSMLICLLLLFSVLSQAACNEAEATRKFLETLDDAQQVSLSVKQFVETIVVAKKMKPETGLAIIAETQRLDAFGEEIAKESQKYLVPLVSSDGVPVLKDGKPVRIVRFTQEGKDTISNLVNSFNGVANGLIDDPRFVALPPPEREQWKAISTALARVVGNSFNLVRQIKPVK